MRLASSSQPIYSNIPRGQPKPGSLDPKACSQGHTKDLGQLLLVLFLRLRLPTAWHGGRAGKAGRGCPGPRALRRPAWDDSDGGHGLGGSAGAENEGSSGARFHLEEPGVGGVQKRKPTQDFWEAAEVQGGEGRGELR